MRNKLTDLNNILFEQLERLQDDHLTDEQLQKEITRNSAVAETASIIVKNAELALKVIKFKDDRMDISRKIPDMLMGE